MSPAPEWLRDLALLLARLAFGGLMLVEHGLGKVERLTGEGPVQFADPLGLGVETSLWLAAGAETVGAGMLVLGLFTRLACIPLAFTMGVAAFVVHQGDPLGDREPSLLYLAAYLLIFAMGPGRASLGQLLARRLPRKGPLAFILA